ncbi:MAG: pirin family protein [Rhodospirillaceae bacterium]|jgi:quercetin 2,3-dioxygenase|nr:pirin family protein [Rhodospirillaceae bacterium]MBT7954993.1 pirin family protein [Rhodospirillaceae bacterium]
MTSLRTISNVYAGMPTTDGAGVKLTRMVGTPELDQVDPFLMLDRMDTDDPDAYIAGFPDHPHRGFETVSIMLEGQMRHWDSVGNEGVLKPGDVQWMTAGRGIIHSEIPEMLEGRLRGFQLWVNLPAEYKMVAPKYQDIPAAQIPVVELDGGSVRVIRGTYEDVTGPAESLMPVRVLDANLDAGAGWSISPEEGRNLFFCIHEGSVTCDGQEISAPSIITFDGDGDVEVKATDDGASILFCEGTALNEPIARYGPFVMNTHSEIRQAVDDFNNGTLAT